MKTSPDIEMPQDSFDGAEGLAGPQGDALFGVPQGAPQGAPEKEQLSRAGESVRLNRIASVAYDIYQSRGGADGNDLEDWLEAERLVDGHDDGTEGR